MTLNALLPVLSEEVCILSASGTAAILNPRYMREGCLDIGLVDHRFLLFWNLLSFSPPHLPPKKNTDPDSIL